MKKNISFKKIKKSFLIVFLFLVNLSLTSSFAAETRTFKEFANNLTDNVLTTSITLLMTGAFLFFFYGVVVFIYGKVTGKGDLNDTKKGQEFMLWGLVALFVMVSVWGIIKLAQGLIGLDGGDANIDPIQINMN